MKAKLSVCKKCPHFGEGKEKSLHVYMCFLKGEWNKVVLAEIDSMDFGKANYASLPDDCPYVLEHTLSGS